MGSQNRFEVLKLTVNSAFVRINNSLVLIRSIIYVVVITIVIRVDIREPPVGVDDEVIGINCVLHGDVVTVVAVTDGCKILRIVILLISDVVQESTTAVYWSGRVGVVSIRINPMCVIITFRVVCIEMTRATVVERMVGVSRIVGCKMAEMALAIVSLVSSCKDIGG